MIAEFVKKALGSNHGFAPTLIKYIFGVSKDNDKVDPEKKHQHKSMKEKVS